MATTGENYMAAVIGSWFGWFKVRWITMELFEKSNEAIFILVGTIFSVVGLVHLL